MMKIWFWRIVLLWLLTMTSNAFSSSTQQMDFAEVEPIIQVEETAFTPSTASTESAVQQVFATYLQRAKEQNLAQHPTWKRLLYDDGKGKSQVEYEGFFLHPQGKTQFDLELETDILALFDVQADNQSFRCRFPARSRWLIEQLKIQQLPDVQCSEFDDWFKTINPHTATLIFATDYMGSPGSMFGHTLLRFDPPKQQGKSMELVSYALNYAAIVPPEDSISYAWKGLTGVYPAEFSLMKYYHKVKEYGDFESRDLWEYQLNLSPEEVHQLVRHIWELKQVRIPYYFIDENCSYALLGLMDLLRPDLKLQEQFGMTAIPIETVKAVKQAGLIEQTHYRPALETQLVSQEKQHGSSLAKVAHRLTLPSSSIEQMLNAYSSQQQAQLLEMAYDDLYLRFVRNKVDTSFAQSRLRQLLALRSQLNLEKQRVDVSRPKYDPTQGHDARIFSIQAGKIQQDNAFQLDYRVAYHQRLDPLQGYREGTQLLFLNGGLLFKDGEIRLADMDILSVHTLNPMTAFKSPWSWGFDLAWKNVAIDSEGQFSTTEQHGVAHLSTQFGYGKAWQNNDMLCSMQVKGAVQAGKSLDKGWRAGLAPLVNCTVRWSDRWQQFSEIEAMYWHDQQQWQWNVLHQLNYAWSPQHSLGVQWQLQKQNQQKWDKMMVGYRYFF